MESAQRVLVNEGQGWDGAGAAAKGPQQRNQGRHDAERPQSALSTSSSISCQTTASSASLPRSSPLLSPANSTSPAASSCGDAGTEGPGSGDTLIRMEGRRPSSASGVGTAANRASQGGLFRRSKSSPSLQQAEEEEGGRRTLWGWGQRPLLPPPHFYYCPHTPPRNIELRDEDIPEGVDRVKMLKKRIESESPDFMKNAAEGARRQKASSEASVGRRRTLNGALLPKGTPLPYRTPSFGGSMIQLNQRSTTLPLRGGGANAAPGKHGATQSPQGKMWRSTLPRDGVQNMYWNGISTIGRNRSSAARPPGHQGPTPEEDGEVRVSHSTLERIRARGSSVTYYGGRVVKEGAPADPTLAIMEEIRRQRAAEGGCGERWTKCEEWVDGEAGGRDSSYGSAESTPTPSTAPTPPLPPSSPPRTPSPAKVVSATAKGGGGGVGDARPIWSGKCSVVFDFRPGKGGEGWREEERGGRDVAWEGGKLCY